MRSASVGKGWILLLLLSGSSFAAPAAPSLETQYAQRLKKIDRKKAADWMALADFCLQQQMDLREKWADALRQALKLDPTLEDAHLLLGDLKVGGKWVDGAKAESLLAEEARQQRAKGLVFYGSGWIDAAKAKGMREEDRAKLAWQESWGLAQRLDTTHLTIYSACSLETTWKLAGILEREFAVYRHFHADVLKLPPWKRFQVQLFKDEKHTLEHEKATGGSPPDGFQGVYDQATRTLHTTLPEKAPAAGQPFPVEDLANSVHEFFHAIDDQVFGMEGMNRFPLWVVESRAEYLTGCTLASGQIVLGAVQVSGNVDPGKLTALMPGLPLSRFFSMDRQTFLSSADHYTYGWGFAHFLLHAEGGRYAQGFGQYLRKVQEGGDGKDFETCVAPAAELEPAFRKYATSELPKRAQAGRKTGP